MTRIVSVLTVTIALALPVVAHAAVRPADAAAGIVAASGGRAEIRLHRLTGAARVLRTPAGTLAVEGGSQAERARDAVARYGAAFGIVDPAAEIVLLGGRAERLGGTVWRFGQQVDGVPVLGAELRVRLDGDGRLTSLNGLVLPGAAIPAGELVPAGRLAETAAAVVAKHHGLDPAALETADLGLALYRPGLVRGLRDGGDHLVRRFEVRSGDRIAELVLVDSIDGRPVERIPLIHELHRVVHEGVLHSPIWTEGDPLPFDGLDDAANHEVNEIIAATGETYRLFDHLSDGTFRSWNGADGTMNAVHDSDELQCPNAQWTGRFTRFCRGTGTDDIVAHEWVHAYTQSTHGLVYLYQQGALNEAYSDIFGEVVDLLNERPDDELQAPRSYEACSAFASAVGPRVIVTSPPDLAGGLEAGGADFNPLPPWSVEGLLELGYDGQDVIDDGCEPLIGFTPGNIALLEFGRCLFRQPVENAQAAGAAGAILVNRANDQVVQMPGPGDRLPIPAVMVGRSDGDRLRAALADGVTVRLSSVSESSERWLIGEDASAFGGAIRDMWTPACLGDPGSVTAANYWCDEGDNGGVHINSGIPNRVFALAADGGTTPAGPVRGIGLTKASHIWWRAMSVYQIPLTDFRDHADLLELSCQDLAGATLTDLTDGGPSSAVIDADDCAQVATAIEAVQLRAEPAQCDFAPVLGKSPPAVRGELVLLDERFDADPGADWGRSTEGVIATAAPAEWQWTDAAPEGGDGGALYVANLPRSGGCNATFLGVSRLDSPPVSMPAVAGALLVFDHYVATEPTRDGGNLKLSVNGGPFEVVPLDAFRYNHYNDTLAPPSDNPNPLAGQPVWTGYDEGALGGSWGQTQVDLSRLVAPGDTFRFRFEFGNDTCVGGEGWYVDTVRVVATPQVRSSGPRVAP